MSGHFFRCALVLVLLFPWGKTRAQLNESDTLRFQLLTGLTGAWQGGNVELLILRGRYELVSNGNNDFVFKSQGTNLYQSFSGRQADNDVYSRNFLFWKAQRKVYPFAISFLQANYRRNIQYRWFAGTGITWQILPSTSSILKLSASLVRENTRFRSNRFNHPFYNGQTHMALWRATLYLAGSNRFFGQKVSLIYHAYWQPAFDQVPNNRFQADLGMEFPLSMGLRFRIDYLYGFEQVVVEQVKQVDHLFTFGLQYQLQK